MKAIYMKELRGYFKSPLGYIFIAVVLALFGVFYSIYALYSGYSNYGSTVLASAFSPLMFIIPILTMRIFSEETKNKTDQMLMTAPVSNWSIVMGKFLGATTVLSITLVLTMLQPLTTVLFYSGEVGYATVIGGYIALFLLSVLLLSIGMLVSSLTENQLVSVVVTMGIALFINLTSGISTALPESAVFSVGFLVVLLAVVVFLLYRAMHDWIVCGIVGGLGVAVLVVLYIVAPAIFEGLAGTMVEWINPLKRMNEIFTGLFNFSQIIYFIAFTGFFLFLTVQVLEKKRWS